MGKIVKEIIENFPELEKDKDVLDKTADFLNKNKPNINIDKKFKTDLKSRLDNLILIKTGRKNKFSLFLIPVFSFMFIVTGVFYYFKDIDFLISDNPDIVKEISEDDIKIKDIKIREVDEIGKILQQELDLVLEEEKIAQEKLENNIIEEIETKEILGEKETNIIQRSSLEVNTVEEKDLVIDDNEDLGVTIMNKETEVNSEKVEDNQLIEMFGLSDSELENLGNLEANGFGSDESIMMDNIEADGGLYKSVVIYSFSDYCEDLKGQLTGTGQLEKCILDEKECFSSEFENGTCEFK